MNLAARLVVLVLIVQVARRLVLIARRDGGRAAWALAAVFCAWGAVDIVLAAAVTVRPGWGQALHDHGWIIWTPVLIALAWLEWELRRGETP